VTRPRLAEDAHARVADAQDPAAAVVEVHAVHQQIGAADGRVGWAWQVRGERLPAIQRHDRDLPATTLRGVATQTAAGDQLARVGGVHRPPVHPLDPDSSQSSHVVSCVQASVL
jgi:hypothetical protein